MPKNSVKKTNKDDEQDKENDEKEGIEDELEENNNFEIMSSDELILIFKRNLRRFHSEIYISDECKGTIKNLFENYLAMKPEDILNSMPKNLKTFITNKVLNKTPYKMHHAIIDFLMADIVERSGNCLEYRKAFTLQPYDIWSAILCDNEISQLFNWPLIPVRSNISKESKKNHKKYSAFDKKELLIILKKNEITISEYCDKFIMIWNIMNELGNIFLTKEGAYEKIKQLDANYKINRKYFLVQLQYAFLDILVRRLKENNDFYRRPFFNELNNILVELT